MLQRLEAGELTDVQADHLLAHIADCRLCAEMLERVRRNDLDTRILRRAVASTSRGAPPTIEAALTDRANAIRKSNWNIPDYECVHLCGEGAFGTVWAVRDRVGVFRALKVIDLSRVAQTNVQCRELTALESFCRHVEPHPNLIRIYHVGILGDKLYYTMDLADDDASRRPVRDALPREYRPMTLQSVMRGQPISVDTAIEVVLRLLRGLSHLHGVGLAHRDIKPANIVFVGRQPRLSDIGMLTSNTVTPSQVGTPDYMPPDGRMDLTADTFAMGRVLYELMVGEGDRKFPRLPEYAMAGSDRWDMSRLQEVLVRACAPTAERRHPHAERLLEDIETCRRWSYDSLFAELDDRSLSRTADQGSWATPVTVAALNTLPWILGFILALVLVQKMF